MSFNRPMYDKCEEVQMQKASIKAGNYQLETPVICNNVLNTDVWVQNQKTGDSMNKNAEWRFYDGPVDVSSELLNLNKPLSKCNSSEYKNQFNPNFTKDENAQNYNFQQVNFNTVTSRLNDPASNIRGMTINRWTPLFWNPQDQVMYNQTVNIPTRLMVRDNHRACLPQVRINDMSPAKYYPNKLPVVPTVSTPGNFVSTGYQYNVCG